MKPSTAQRLRLLKLLGHNPDEHAPQSLAEARDLTNHEPLARNYPEPTRCPSSNKHQFHSEHQAKKAARSRLNKGANTSRLRTYHCPDCHQWHISSSFHQ